MEQGCFCSFLYCDQNLLYSLLDIRVIQVDFAYANGTGVTVLGLGSSAGITKDGE